MDTAFYLWDSNMLYLKNEFMDWTDFLHADLDEKFWLDIILLCIFHF